MNGRIPKAIWEGEFSIAGVPLKCAVLEDGSRIIEAESFRNFIDALENGTVEFGPADLVDFARWQSGAH